ncbi:hypothetical protein EPO15_04755 [bacterium]|nr:MAG: hypothetical protein EPO15_04755 [bacterium]
MDESLAVPLGKAAVRREGKDLSVVATSWMVPEAVKAADVLARRGVSLEVVDVRSVSPLDSETVLASVRKTRHAVVADYDWSFCGFSAELAALIHQGCWGTLAAPVERLGFAHAPCPTTRPLENRFYPSAVEVVRAAEKLLGLSPTDLSGEEFYSWEKKFKGPF